MAKAERAGGIERQRSCGAGVYFALKTRRRMIGPSELKYSARFGWKSSGNQSGHAIPAAGQHFPIRCRKWQAKCQAGIPVIRGPLKSGAAGAAATSID
jgi:hypothetical protein